jgi:DNA polymerase-1
VQGSAADIIKAAMIVLERRLGDGGAARMIMQVHDELVFEVTEKDAGRVTEIVKQEMESILDRIAGGEFGSTDFKPLTGLKVDIKAGRNWDEAH